MFGEIEITSNGDFVRCFRENGQIIKREGIYSPIVQNERHVEMIKSILKGNRIIGKNYMEMVQHIVTIANPKTVINGRYASKEIKDHIIKHEHLTNKMKSLQEACIDSNWFTEKTMYAIADCLMKYNQTNTFDYWKKYGISSSTHTRRENYTTRSSQDFRNNSNSKGHQHNPGNSNNIRNNQTNRSNRGFSGNKQNSGNNPNLKANNNIGGKHNFNRDNRNQNFRNNQSIEKNQHTKNVLSIKDNPLYKKLNDYRYSKSIEENIRPHFVFTNQHLELLVRLKPRTINELMTISGFDNMKCNKYGEDIMDIINNYIRRE